MAGGPQPSFAAELVAEWGEFGEIDLDDLLGVHAEEEFVRLAAVGELEVGLVGIDEDFLDDARVLKEFDGAVDGGLADAAALALEGGLQLLGLEEVVEAEERVENLGALGGVFLADGFQVASEDGAERLDDLYRVGVGVARDGFQGH